jgi:hypothetical protein
MTDERPIPLPGGLSAKKSKSPTGKPVGLSFFSHKNLNELNVVNEINVVNVRTLISFETH